MVQCRHSVPCFRDLNILNSDYVDYLYYVIFYSSALVKNCGSFIFRNYHIQISASRLELGFSFMKRGIFALKY
jgi:hypothetical protein